MKSILSKSIFRIVNYVLVQTVQYGWNQRRVFIKEDGRLKVDGDLFNENVKFVHFESTGTSGLEV